MRIKEIDIQDYARQLLEAHGAKAVVEAAKRLVLSRRKAKKKTPKLGGTSRRR